MESVKLRGGQESCDAALNSNVDKKSDKECVIPTANLAAYHYNRDMMDPFLSVCSFLFKNSGINFFRYMRIFENGQYISLGTQLNYMQYYLENIKNLGAVFKPIVLNAPEEKYQFYLWPDDINHSEAQKDKVFSALHAYNIWNGFSVYRKTNHYVESWNFAGSLENSSLRNFYINHLEFIKDFIHHFQTKSKFFLDFYNASSFASFETPLILRDGTDNTNLALKSPSYHTIYHMLDGQLNTLSFSHRQWECLKLLSQGNSMKKIAQILNIGPRTVEDHINKIKLKSGLRFKSQLIDFFYSQT